ncbi:patatin-like phospholipase family protein [Calidifontimicrobium sp. SYSU G02091]|uniref:patatin-like phospholipase family protein n=1 Tax=Calidifontimicrobium sp. SYSU G02091 TaxID=2926421 RepID=UPI001F53D976|nr:patatin-like phospholipase family protein [Calidifontimicrobium sp. SYSU G02091]MCI1192503.1 patatin-like phospholipase family protein [Calidifontimicrobium sp. SYSU G02091]
MPAPLRRLARTLAAWAWTVAAATLVPTPPAQAQPLDPASPAAAATRPRVGLVLSGGGARGLAHVGVLKVLERERIPIDVIAGTSMGAIIGGLYASGMSAEQLERELLAVRWDALFASRVDRRELPQRRKEEDFDVAPNLEFGVRDGELRAPVAAVSSRGLELLLRRYTLPVRGVTEFDRLPIPFRAVATDMETGQPVVLDRGDLALALRSSMSVPGVFAPTEVGGRVLGDGGLVNNVPIDVARAMGADVVIVVNIGTPLAPRESLGSVVGVTAQMINILTEQNVQRSLATLGPRDVLVAPQLGALTAGDFERTRELIALGASGAEAALARLAALSVPAADYAEWTLARTRGAAPAPALGFVAFEGTRTTNPARYADELETQPGMAFDRERAERDARRLAATGDYLRTDYRIAEVEGREGLVFDLEDKPWGPNYLRVGLTMDTDFRGDSGFNVRLLHVRRWLTPDGAEWRNLLQIGEAPTLATELYRPLGVGRALQADWFIAPYAGVQRRRVVLYDPDDLGLELAQYRRDILQAGVDLGRPWGRVGELRLGLSWLNYRNVPDSFGFNRIELVSQRFVERALRARLVVDQLDFAFFPTRGYRLEAVAAAGLRDARGRDERFQRAEVEAMAVGTFGAHTLDVLAQLQATNADGLDVFGRYTLGGFQRLSGYRTDQLNGNAVVLLRLGWRTPLTGRLLFARNLVVGATLEAGNAWLDTDAARLSDLRTGGSLYLGTDTGVGPVHFGLTYAPGGSLGIALFVGRP